MYIDRVDISGYHWVSAADHLVLDPAGAIGLQGYVAGHTYFKDALDKLGIGFDEWRLFQYKSANEAYVRRDMSAGEREQLTTLLDDWYALARSDISADRSLTPEQFDQPRGRDRPLPAARSPRRRPSGSPRTLERNRPHGRGL